MQGFMILGIIGIEKNTLVFYSTDGPSDVPTFIFLLSILHVIKSCRMTA